MEWPNCPGCRKPLQSLTIELLKGQVVQPTSVKTLLKVGFEGTRASHDCGQLFELRSDVPQRAHLSFSCYRRSRDMICPGCNTKVERLVRQLVEVAELDELSEQHAVVKDEKQFLRKFSAFAVRTS